jgi:hypothetical protein
MWIMTFLSIVCPFRDLNNSLARPVRDQSIFDSPPIVYAMLLRPRPAEQVVAVRRRALGEVCR